MSHFQKLSLGGSEEWLDGADSDREKTQNWTLLDASPRYLMVIIEAAKHPFLLDVRFAGTIQIRFVSMRVRKHGKKAREIR